MDINEDSFVEKRQQFRAGRCQAVDIVPFSLSITPEDDTCDQVRGPRLAA